MRKLLISAVLGIAALSGCSRDKPPSGEVNTENLPTISVDEVDQGIAANQVTAIDCNGDKTRKKHGIVPGAVLVDDEETYAATDLPADKARKLAFYCSGPG
jgi:hypothetical protein